MKRGLRQKMADLHSWSGLLLGWLLFAMCVTGTASVFKAEISAWMRPEVSAHVDPARAVAAAARYLARAHGDLSAWYLNAPDDRAATTQAVYTDPAAPEGYADVALDPVTGRPDTMRSTLGGEFFYRFHFELQLPYPWGRMLAAFATMMMLVALVSGIITHRRIFADFFTMRPGKGQRSWLDAHNALGVLAMPFHLMITFTGLVTLASIISPWAAKANYGKDMGAYFQELGPGFYSRPASGTAARLPDILPLLKDAKRRMDGHIGGVTIENPGDTAALVTVSRNDHDQIAYGKTMLSYDAASGHLVHAYEETRPAKSTFDTLYGLHIGRFAPSLSRWLYFVCGLALSAAIATGLQLWIAARSRRNAFGHRLVARLNVAAIAGLPLAMLGYFWANRLLPTDLPARASMEVSCFFWSWCAAGLFALIVPPRLGWTILSGLVALGAALLPIMSFALTGRGLWQALAQGDPVFAGFDLLLWVFAALFAVVTFRMARKVAA